MITTELLFPYECIRPTQDELMLAVKTAIENKTNLIAHAPTGLGKTIAVLAPALKFALTNGLSIFFLTSKHTQHQIVVNTIKQIRKKSGINIRVSDIIGKKWMCLQQNVDELYSMNFHDFCNSLVEERLCEFYVNTRQNTGSPTLKAKRLLGEITILGPLHTEDVIEECKKEKFCPYEISSLLAKESDVIIADYYYVFDPHIRELFFQKTDKKLEKSIIIIDEGHNLPKRCQQLMSSKLTNFMLERAFEEAKRFKFLEALDYLSNIEGILSDYTKLLKTDDEDLVSREDFMEKINDFYNYETLITDLEYLSKEVRVTQKLSYLGGIAKFLDNWRLSDDRFARIFSRVLYNERPNLTLMNKCLDSSIVSKDVIDGAYSTIIMSGTLTPTGMYKDLLGFNSSIEKTYKSPFPKHNRLNLIIPTTTTKYTERDETQYKSIAKIINEICSVVSGNLAVFFPSYKLRDDISNYLVEILEKRIVMEVRGLTKKEKTELIERFKADKDKGSVLLGVSSASFGEGIDLPGDFLKCVIVVGMPLEKPNLEIKELIRYYDKKFGSGWDYGYVFPAINKCLQNAGRCIRSETDKGIIVFLDERYAYTRYLKCFPPEWEIKITKEYLNEIRRFLRNEEQI